MDTRGGWKTSGPSGGSGTLAVGGSRPSVDIHRARGPGQRLARNGRLPRLLPKHPRHIGCDPPLADFLDRFDVLTLWTWNSKELPQLEESLAALEAVAAKNCRIALGMYLWDFPNARPVPLELMQHQCELGLKWLKEKRVHELVFLANTVLDVGLPSAEFSRNWIAKVGRQPV